jgi:hypothetical protein
MQSCSVLLQVFLKEAPRCNEDFLKAYAAYILWLVDWRGFARGVLGLFLSSAFPDCFSAASPQNEARNRRKEGNHMK